MPAQASIEPGFRDPVRDAQSTFRVALEAMARPGRILAMESRLAPPPPLMGPLAALLLTLCDFETPVWLDQPLAESAGVVEFLRFHTGARVVAAPADAAYAAISTAEAMPALDAFAQGTPDYPDRSATLLVGVRELSAEGWTLTGPGIRGETHFSAKPVPMDFTQRLRANRAQFPRGVDIFFVTDTAIAALPRSVSLTEGA
jgi:alpha-D-ribose 1-methylphosphonate 5-triphosphate synthase subunit PhnH